MNDTLREIVERLPEYRALAEATTLDQLPTVVLVATIKDLAESLV